MREIQFRAWNPDSKSWIEGFDIDNNGNIWHNHFGYPDAVIMQYTGLKAKNGEIYEGDIITFKNADGDEFTYEVEYDPYDGYKFPTGIAKQGTIIGNVHENPELLKEATQ